MLEIGIFGATGKVGKLLIKEILQCKKSSLTSVFVRNELQYNIPSSVLITKDMKSFLDVSGIIIDFSNKEATENLLQCAFRNPKPLVIGTTGLDKTHFDLIKKCSKKMPLLYSANMSEGIAVLDKITEILSAKLREYDIEITEIHHKHKKDAPSGTALALATTAARVRKLNEESFRFGRNGECERIKDEIGVLSLRGGDVVGRHTVGFYNDGEYLELTHNATSRATFAKGALHAAQWLSKQQNGLYTMQDIFDFKITG
ncbi:4-hydroxy-tetrahydrodipicolinate reductase [Helicobacter didelphidarum]|uniref:4-hydroxy-tetrahydrodipicolinate reductase n=1 Tax=Helicobacter didelphidarum TaxID=2040648 RepID=A0A3D8IQ81_9HELI|nr:4-hydroxy-tetrahydrodipicolinate reductase [Helicobacter didelphidarum]RDU67140.1 4-hydroxy-tetrahydrodipicolinate reductase [Helicobacter didelphidarum]